MFDFLPSVLRTPLAFVIVLGVLVFVHEMGHYLAARWRGVHVEAFSIGFGRPWASWTDRHGTVWRLAWIPLGGYVKLHGQERPEDVVRGTRAAWQAGRTFHGESGALARHRRRRRADRQFRAGRGAVHALFAAVGRPIAVPVVGDVLPGSAAAQAGLQANDRIVEIGDSPIKRFEDIQRIVGAPPAQR